MCTHVCNVVLEQIPLWFPQVLDGNGTNVISFNFSLFKFMASVLQFPGKEFYFLFLVTQSSLVIIFCR